MKISCCLYAEVYDTDKSYQTLCNLEGAYRLIYLLRSRETDSLRLIKLIIRNADEENGMTVFGKIEGVNG